MKKLTKPKSGIDVSHWQGDIDWKVVSESGIDFAIIKVGGFENGLPYEDPKAEINYKQASKYMNTGLYYYAGKELLKNGSYFAIKCDELMQSIAFVNGPIFIDIEETEFLKYPYETTVEVNKFLDFFRDRGFPVGVYASDISGFKNSLDIKNLSDCLKWVARYGKAPEYISEPHIWQTSGRGVVNGIKTVVDTNICYYDIFTAKETKLITTKLLLEVLNGKWGNGQERKEKLEKMGYDPEKVQLKINDYIKNPIKWTEELYGVYEVVNNIKHLCDNILGG